MGRGWGPIGGSGWRGGLGDLPTPLVMLCAGVMLLLLVPQMWQLGFGFFVSYS